LLRPSESHDTITPQRVVRILWRRRLVCLIVAAVVFLGGAAYLLTRPRIYESSSSVAFLPVSNNAAVLPNYPNLITSLIPTYVQLVSSSALLDQVAPMLPFRITASQLANDVFGESLSNAAVINIVGVSTDPVRAQEIAAATASVFLAHVRGNGVVVAQIYARPTVPDQPSSPKTKLLLPLMLIVAVALGLGAGLIWDRLFGGAEDEDRSTETTPRPPVLGIVPESGLDSAVGSIRGGPEDTVAHDGWHSLRTNFMYALLGQQMHSVTVISAEPGPAKTTVAAGLAATVAEMGLAVVLVDADVRRSKLHEVFSLDNGQGLTSTILDGAEPASLLRSVPTIAGLQVVTAGPPLPAQQDEASIYREQLPQLTSLADLVIVDGPSLRGDMGAGLVARLTDGVVLVVHSELVTWKQVRATIRELTASGARVLGTVLTGMGSPADLGESPADLGES
jgi:succinoglycan biosynthesis transport protein ExoP